VTAEGGERVFRFRLRYQQEHLLHIPSEFTEAKLISKGIIKSEVSGLL
jgi:hypothetical protein